MDFEFTTVSSQEYERLCALYGPLTQSLRRLIDAGIRSGADEQTIRDAQAAIDAVAGTALNDPFSFIGTNAFTGVKGQLRWQDSGSDRLIMGDVNGDMVADLRRLYGHTQFGVFAEVVTGGEIRIQDEVLP